MFGRIGAVGGAIRRWVGVGRRVVEVAREQEVTFLAASVAYYAFVSLVPAAVLALVIAASLGGETFATAVLEATGQFLTPHGEEVLLDALTASEGRGGATVLGLLVLAWGTLKVFRGLDTAFSKVYGAERVNTAVDQVIDSGVVIVSVGLTLVLMVVVGGVLATVHLGGLEVLSVLVLPLVLTLAFLPMYYRFPDVPVTLREVLPGAAFAGVGWTLLQAGFQLYTETASQTAYGAVGAVLLLVTWLYFAGVIVIFGAVLNVVLAEDKVPGTGGPSPAKPGHERVDERDESADGGSRPGWRRGAPPSEASTTATATATATTAAGDRQTQGPGRPAHGRMADEGRESGGREPGDGARDDAREDAGDGGESREPRGAPDVTDLADRLEEVRADLDAFEREIEERTVDRPRVEAELRRYVRSRLRQGHARGWGPYLVLLYGTVMTLGAFYWLRASPWAAVAAMLVIFTSTLGLYVLFVLFGGVLGVVGAAGGLLDRLRGRKGE